MVTNDEPSRQRMKLFWIGMYLLMVLRDIMRNEEVLLRSEKRNIFRCGLRAHAFRHNNHNNHNNNNGNNAVTCLCSAWLLHMRTRAPGTLHTMHAVPLCTHSTNCFLFFPIIFFAASSALLDRWHFTVLTDANSCRPSEYPALPFTPTVVNRT